METPPPPTRPAPQPFLMKCPQGGPLPPATRDISNSHQRSQSQSTPKQSQPENESQPQQQQHSSSFSSKFRKPSFLRSTKPPSSSSSISITTASSTNANTNTSSTSPQTLPLPSKPSQPPPQLLSEHKQQQQQQHKPPLPLPPKHQSLPPLPTPKQQQKSSISPTHKQQPPLSQPPPPPKHQSLPPLPQAPKQQQQQPSISSTHKQQSVLLNSKQQQQHHHQPSLSPPPKHQPLPPLPPSKQQQPPPISSIHKQQQPPLPQTPKYQSQSQQQQQQPLLPRQLSKEQLRTSPPPVLRQHSKEQLRPLVSKQNLKDQTRPVVLKQAPKEQLRSLQPKQSIKDQIRQIPKQNTKDITRPHINPVKQSLSTPALTKLSPIPPPHKSQQLPSPPSPHKSQQLPSPTPPKRQSVLPAPPSTIIKISASSSTTTKVQPKVPKIQVRQSDANISYNGNTNSNSNAMKRKVRSASRTETDFVRRRSSSTDRTEGLSFKPHKNRFPLRCIYVNEAKERYVSKVSVMTCTHGMQYSTLLDEFLSRWNIDVFQREDIVTYFLDCSILQGNDIMDMDKNEWIKKALDLGVTPTIVIINKNLSIRFTKRSCWDMLFGKPALNKTQTSNDSKDNYLLQIRVAEGAQIVNAYCPWETTFADIKKTIVPLQLGAHNGPKDLSQIIVDSPSILGTLSENDENNTSFFALCKAAYCLPHVMIRESVPRDIAPVRCETHHSDCVIVDSADLTSHYPESKASDFRINMEISRILKDKSATKKQQLDRETELDELTAFRAAAKRLRFSVLGSGGFGAVAYAELPRAISSAPHAFPPGEMLLAAVKLPLRDMVKTVPIRPGISADAFSEGIFDKFCASVAPPDKTARDYVLKVKGINSYIVGAEAVLHFAHIQSALLKKNRPELVFIERPPEDQSFEREEHYTFANLLAIRDDGVEYKYENISIRNVPAARRVCIPSWDLVSTPFRVKVVGIDKTQCGVDPGKPCFVAAELFYGDCPLCKQAVTKNSLSLQWNETLTFDIPLSQIPLEARVCFTLYALSSESESQILQQQLLLQQGQLSEAQQQALQQLQQQQSRSQNGMFEKPLGWVSCTVFDYMNILCRGKKVFYLWPNERANPAGGSWESCTQAKSSGKLIVEFEDYLTPVVFPTHGVPQTAATTTPSPRKSIFIPNNTNGGTTSDGVVGDQQRLLAELEAKDSLYRMTDSEKKILWDYRTVVMQRPRLLGKVLQALDYRNPADVIEGHRIMTKVHLVPEDALELLASKFPDRAVREYAVQSLRRMPTEDLMSYLLELVQALKYEPRHNSALASLLLEKGYISSAVGTELYWALKSGMTYGDSPARFQAVMDAFLRGCGEGRNTILMQEEFLGTLQTISREVKALKDCERLEYLHKRLKEVTIPRGLFVPVRPDFLIGGIEIEKCSYKDSKKLPLYVVLRNAEADCDSFHMIFKEGDDLRQDGLTLQMIRIMDKMWKDVGLDLEMLPYRTICTEAASGLIEVVLNSKTTAEIHKAAGGASAAFKQDPLANWLRQHNPTEDKFRSCVKRFLKSCAGYCVATYVLGIGDRHNDNIMLTKTGNLFHIDFGHFLGHKKYFLGFNREPASFVFTPDFAYVMGGKGAPDFEEFVETACRAYLVLRKHSSTFINLFALMLSTGIPELKSTTDIDYLRDAFALELDEAGASNRFKELIYSSLATWTTRLNNAIHIAMH